MRLLWVLGVMALCQTLLYSPFTQLPLVPNALTQNLGKGSEHAKKMPFRPDIIADRLDRFYWAWSRHIAHFINTLRRYDTRYGSQAWQLAGGFFLLAVAARLFVTSARTLAALAVGIGWLMRSGLLFCSLLSLLVWLLYRQNLWQLVGPDLFLAPTAWMLSSSLVLLLHDFNYPAWTRALRALFLPLVSGVLMAAAKRAGL